MTIKEAGATARSALNIFAKQPLVLALILMNLALLGLLYWERTGAAHERQRELDLIFQNRKYEADLLYENRKYVTDALANCVPAALMPTPPPKPQ